MDPARTLRPAPASALFTLRIPILLVGVALVVACSFPVLTASRGRLTSDESLYAGEALNIYLGRGAEYTTGAPVTHRAPLYPAILAADFKIAGASLDAASLVPRLATFANAVLVLLLARRLAGTIAGVAAALVVATSPFVNGLGASLFLDSVESSFILASLLVTAAAIDRRSIAAAAAGGALLGLAVLVKESAVLLAPLPVVVLLLRGDSLGWRARLAAWYAGLLAAAGWWWAWVFLKAGSIYLLGDAGDRRVQAAALAGVVAAVMVSVSVLRHGRASLRPTTVTRLAGWLFMAAWAVAAVAGLEWQSWEHPRRYLTDVPAYFAHTLVPAIPAFPLMAASLVWASARTATRALAGPLIAAAAGLFLPFVLFSANRELALRDSLPFLYFGAVAFGCGCSWLIDWGADLARRGAWRGSSQAGAVVVAVILVAICARGLGRVERAGAVLYQDDWDNIAARETAAWLDANVPPGTSLMSGRLYFSHVYFLTAARFPVHQVPTVLVQFSPRGEPFIRPRSTLFRWEPLPERERRSWLYLTYYREKGYFVGLAEEDLLADIEQRGARFLVVNVSDAAFSSPALLDYLDANPSFSRVYEKQYTAIDSTVVYRVDLDSLRPVSRPVEVTLAAYEELSRRGMADLDTKLAALGAGGFLLVP